MKMKKLLFLLLLILPFAGCQKDGGSILPQTVRQSCETDNRGYVRIANHTSSSWKYRYTDLSGTVCTSDLAPRMSSARRDLPAGRIHIITGYYAFSDNGTDYYSWDRFVESIPIRTCVTDTISFNDDCETQGLGYLIYANACTASVTIRIDGATVATISPGETQGYAVVAGVIHQIEITGTALAGNVQATPSVGKCERLATVIR